MHKLFLALCVSIIGCVDTQLQADPATGRLQNGSIREASGLARSNIDASRLWVINDGGSGPDLYAVGVDGSDQGVFRLAGSRNHDWEDLASFALDDQPMLLIADIGDNLALRRFLTLYILHEPRPKPVDDGAIAALEIAWQVALEYPDGPVDAESVSVDVEQETVLILSKRDVPAVLYQVPLRSGSGNSSATITATRIGTVSSLPQPSKLDRDRALARQDWYWQPTAMDLSASGKTAAILTYRGIYLYPRANGQSWYEALQHDPRIIEMSGVENAEAIAFSADGNAVFVTTEERHAPLLRYDIN